MNISKEKYSKMTDKASPPSKTPRNCIVAFLTGGLICTFGQLLTDLYKMAGMELKTARALTSVSLVFIGVLLTAVGIYDNIAKHAGAGTLVPITGFANSIASPAIEFKSEGFIPGMSVKMFTIAGPVLVFGISASVLYGVIYYIVKIVMKV